MKLTAARWRADFEAKICHAAFANALLIVERFTDFLKDEGIRDKATAHAIKRVLALLNIRHSDPRWPRVMRGRP